MKNRYVCLLFDTLASSYGRDNNQFRERLKNHMHTLNFELLGISTYYYDGSAFLYRIYPVDGQTKYLQLLQKCTGTHVR